MADPGPGRVAVTGRLGLGRNVGTGRVRRTRRLTSSVGADGRFRRRRGSGGERRHGSRPPRVAGLPGRRPERSAGAPGPGSARRRPAAPSFRRRPPPRARHWRLPHRREALDLPESTASSGMRWVRTRSTLEIGADQPDRRGDARGPGHDHPGDAERVGQPGRVHGTGARRSPTRVKSRGSMPRWTVTTRIAAAILALATSWTARAALDHVEVERPRRRARWRLAGEIDRERDAAGQLARVR